MTSTSTAPSMPRSRLVSQSTLGGVGLLALAAFALWAMSDLPVGTLRTMGPGLLPRWLAYGVAACGVIMLVGSFLRSGEALEAGGGWRGPFFVCLAILVFAITIRPFAFGAGATPGLGLAVAGPLAIIIGGYASPEARLRDLLVLGLALTASCMLLFGDALNLPIPMFPQWITSVFPAGWSQKAALRGVAVAELVLALAIWLTGARSRRRGGPTRIDVAHHSVQI